MCQCPTAINSRRITITCMLPPWSSEDDITVQRSASSVHNTAWERHGLNKKLPWCSTARKSTTLAQFGNEKTSERQ